MRHTHDPRAIALCLLGLCALVAGCGGSPARLTDNPGVTGTDTVRNNGTGTKKEEQTAAKKTNPALRAANAAFAFDLFGRLEKQASANGNVFVSPSSVGFALALVYNGAGGQTRAAVGKTLHVENMALEPFNAGNAALRTALAAGEDAQVQISVANAIWTDQGVTLAPEYLEGVKRFYDAETGTLDFGSASAVETIDRWVQEKTNKKIETLFTEDELKDVIWALANAVYFKGKWTSPFEKSATREGEFTRADGTKKTLPMMSRLGRYRHLRGEGFQALSLPYGKGGFQMVVVLPDPGSDLKTLAKDLSAERWEAWMTELEKAPETEVAVTLPRFKVACEAVLNEPLADMGMAPLFQPGADFAPMGLSGQRLSLVKHKAVIEVNEEGTEAAAVTGIAGVTSIQEPPAFTVNRPFLCAIRHIATGTNLFLGAIRDPQS